MTGFFPERIMAAASLAGRHWKLLEGFMVMDVVNWV
jgi:hypothetical protein